ncbi:MAG: 2-amino-4-hydroxy-6-hydroxymethyldihydropteridine diphosphokinase [Bacteroidia bacterium]|nr:2-amino-4-hydroxy-6-hydroxymethyldihydropteridine diphosphokinase [Bacteroidia bacterium]
MIFLGVGTNLGDKKKNILQAYELLEEKEVKILRKSSFYKSAAWGIRDQNSFLNSVIEVSFEENAERLLEICLEVEKEMGRKRLFKWGPRLIDLDIISFHHEKHHSEKLILPHPFYTQRAFVLSPLAELEENWIDAESGQSIQELLAKIPEEDACTLLGEDE